MLMQIKVALQSAKLRKETDEMLKAPTKPVHRPCSDHIDLAVSSVPEQSIEPRALVPTLRSADASKTFETVASHTEIEHANPKPLLGNPAPSPGG